MKSTKLIVLCTLLSSAAYAQTGYDVQRFSESELNGTARFVGMGGAMGALGADISVTATNPAGIGLFRRNEVSTTASFNALRSKSDFVGNVMKEEKNMASFDQAGFVYSMKIGNRTSMRYINFAFNYHKSNNLNRLFSAGGFLEGLSQTQQMANMVDGSIESISEIDRIYNYDPKLDGYSQNPYNSDTYYPYLGVMGIRSELVTKDQEGVSPVGWYGDRNFYNRREKGGIQDYDFNVAFNIEDRMYFGVTLGIHDVNYTRSTYYSEDIYYYPGGEIPKEVKEPYEEAPYKGYYEIEQAMQTEGTGIDLKLGAIFRPIEDSPFRFGFALHTPTWYDLSDLYDSRVFSKLIYNFEDEQGTYTEKFEANEIVSDYVDGNTLMEYKLVTPWKVNLNMGTTLAGVMALGAEYEYAGYTNSKLRYVDGYNMDFQNDKIKDEMKGMHTLRLGMEARVTDRFSVRAGYNYSSSVFDKGANKALEWYDMRTDTEYNNKFNQNTLTVGLGYKGRIFYVDAAYKYNMYKSDFYAFSAEDLQATKLTNEKHQALVTVGARF